MRRITRRIGLFGGPGAIVKGAGVKTRQRPTSDAAPAAPSPEAGPSSDAESEKKGWWSRLLGSKPDGSS